MSETVIDDLKQRSLDGLRFALGPKVLAALANPDVVEVMLNDDGKLWVESLGAMNHVGEISADDAMAILNTVSSFLNGEVKKEDPFVEGELPLDGERFEGIAPPVAERGSFAIRKKAGKVFTLNDYARNEIITFAQAEQLRAAILGKLNILVIGGTGSGKTTFVNALLHELSLLDAERRMILMEDTRELQCNLLNRQFLRSSPWTTMDRISIAVNRLRPDSITVGEMRAGGVALALLKLWNTGHPGGFGTAHANSAYGGLTRMDQLIQEVSAHPQRGLISEAVNVVVYLERIKGARRVKEIIRVKGYDNVAQEFLTEEIL